MRKYLYTTLFLTLLAQGGVMAQDNMSGCVRLMLAMLLRLLFP